MVGVQTGVTSWKQLYKLKVQISLEQAISFLRIYLQTYFIVPKDRNARVLTETVCNSKNLEANIHQYSKDESTPVK